MGKASKVKKKKKQGRNLWMSVSEGLEGVSIKEESRTQTRQTLTDLRPQPEATCVTAKPGKTSTLHSPSLSY